MTKNEISEMEEKKNEILEMINKNDEFYQSDKFIDELIEDSEYFQKKGIENVIGFGIYDKELENKNRFYLYIKWKNNNNIDKSLTVLLMNPSNSFPKDIAEKKKYKPGFDQTIRNLINFANKQKYNQVEVLNTFSHIESNGKDAKKYYKTTYKGSCEDKLNYNIIEKIINNSKEVLVAYGSNIDEGLHNKYLELLKKIKKEKKEKKEKKDIKLYTYAQELTKNGRPRHLSLQSYNNVQNKRLYELKIVEDKYQVQSDRAEFSFISINNQL